MESSTDQTLANILGRARNGMVISTSMMAHFMEVVPAMNAAGATRRGSKSAQDESGYGCIVDIYVLPDGQTVLAGYRK